MILETKEHSILFSGEMVRAILDGRKTQTRRVVSKRNSDSGRMWDRLEFDEAKLPPGAIPILVDNGYMHVPTRPHPEDCQDGDWWMRTRVYPVWNVGDRLWVRETWAHTNDYDGQVLMNGRTALYAADKDCIIPKRWRPSIFMPRWASRITLEITEVRVQRLHEISEADAIAEGCWKLPASGRITDVPGGQYGGRVWSTARQWYRELWESINQKRGYGWEVNPWVWVITFKRCSR